ncbi:GSCOCG00010834001-RA-CDS [Cotesia congregata]|uniref:Similar to Hr96: Nuclear hormone receptor HR96 (Drosophila melanogaster) n=1 Tax=Cotesia congregata TaxID=51543 RepID=A0A8J2H5W6_COTCN|nr:GSCOCG00010834001-RA-CDS [Cotesia congregata]CAG5077397.1 Similar to Hr96: Nuclear hormone receptor HR96 (Drosophila melanogaster) [Cotesia congregata]
MEDEQTSGREANKICGVCGDRALGYNFNAVSCESCKAFFRRNALKNKDFRCPFSENCNVTPVTRRFCQKCRLDKCFSIGMRKEYIMTEEDKVLKRQKVEQNRAKKRSSDEIRGPKMKREIIEDANFDDTSMSVASVASTVSETYFWESDKKYTDLDGNRERTIESMSPTTAASVPSPSSPPENRDIIGSKTLDMLKDSSQPSQSFKKCSTHLSTKNPCSSEKLITCNVIESLNNEEYSHLDNCGVSSRLDDNLVLSRDKPESSVIEDCTKNGQKNSSIFAEKLTIKSDFFIKILQDNPQLVAKFLEDKSTVSKMMSEPQVAIMLANDPQVSRLLELDSDESSKLNNLTTSRGSNNIICNLLDSEQQNSDNPILTNLITSHKSSESDNKVDEFNGGNDWSRETDDVTRDVVQDVQRIPIAANSIESILCEAIKLEFSAYSALRGNQNSRELNDAERAKLNELIVANKALLAPLDDDITNLIGEECRFKGTAEYSDPMLLDVINLTAVAIRRLIKMAKKINAFKNMCQEDQLALLKGGCTEMMILRSALNYDSDKNMWKIPHSQEKMSKIKVEVLKEAKGNLYSEHARFVGTFDPRWRDENIILILSAIALFTPDRPRVVHSDVIKLEQNSYYYLLRRYLESIYPGCEAKSTFLKLIQKISELHRLNNEVVDVYLNVNPSSVEPLLIEIFDLNH